MSASFITKKPSTFRVFNISRQSIAKEKTSINDRKILPFRLILELVKSELRAIKRHSLSIVAHTMENINKEGFSSSSINELRFMGIMFTSDNLRYIIKLIVVVRFFYSHDLVYTKLFERVIVDV